MVLAVGSLIFAAALVPSLVGKDKPALGTSLPTACALSAFVVVYGSLSLWFSTGTTALTAACWWALAWQKNHSNRGESLRSRSREALP